MTCCGRANAFSGGNNSKWLSRSGNGWSTSCRGNSGWSTSCRGNSGWSTYSGNGWGRACCSSALQGSVYGERSCVRSIPDERWRVGRNQCCTGSSIGFLSACEN
ncbi:MAG: hypothetical protein IKB86_01580 [Clostridia bacterium]|nr:hypothetical protein [Clostridia bacterium]